ncbi:MAG: glycerol-3-phosphate acyltransferase [Acidimicrobiia bacterium]
MGVPVVIAAAYLVGAIPFSNIAARRTRGVDLRHVGTGTVSGTSLYKVAGFVPLAVAGVFEVAKGAVGPALAGDRALLAAVAGGVAVIGHDWSPFLRGAGGRGVAPTLGALIVNAWPGAALVGVAMLVGWATKQTGLGTFIGMVLLVPVLGALYGGSGAIVGVAVAAPMFVKRMVGNARPVDGRAPTYVTRLVFDRDAVQQA